jgi:hypothetical protein
VGIGVERGREEHHLAVRGEHVTHQPPAEQLGDGAALGTATRRAAVAVTGMRSGACERGESVALDQLGDEAALGGGNRSGGCHRAARRLSKRRTRRLHVCVLVCEVELDAHAIAKLVDGREQVEVELKALKKARGRADRA